MPNFVHFCFVFLKFVRWRRQKRRTRLGSHVFLLITSLVGVRVQRPRGSGLISCSGSCRFFILPRGGLESFKPPVHWVQRAFSPERKRSVELAKFADMYHQSPIHLGTVLAQGQLYLYLFPPACQISGTAFLPTGCVLAFLVICGIKWFYIN